jgi:L-iditol 2-dehydrogenase
MKTARLHASGEIRLHDEPKPVPGAGESLVTVKAVGVCGSDLHWFAEGGIGDAQLKQPLVLGHEFAGVTETGERVAVDPAVPCGECDLCETGHPNLCPHVIFAGHGLQDGGLRNFIAWPRKCLFALPDSLSEADGAMLEPLGVAIHAVDLGKLRAGMTVGVFGCGPIGLLIIQLARASGAARILATDMLTHRVDAAKSCGAHHAFLAADGLETGEVQAANAGRGVDVAFEVAGEQGAVETSIAAVTAGGKVILVGIPSDDRTAFPAAEARRKGLTIKLSRRMKHTYPRAIELVSNGQVDVRSLVTHRFPLEKTAEAFAVAARREGLKVIIEPQEPS